MARYTTRGFDLTTMGPFGLLEAIRPAPHPRRPSWECRCRCGAVVVVQACNLLSGNTKSCGCLQKEKAARNGRRAAGKNAAKQCPRCRRHFLGTNKQKFCCYDCKVAADLVARTPIACAFCGKPVSGRRGQSYCSPECKRRGNYLARTGRLLGLGVAKARAGLDRGESP